MEFLLNKIDVMRVTDFEKRVEKGQLIDLVAIPSVCRAAFGGSHSFEELLWNRILFLGRDLPEIWGVGAEDLECEWFFVVCDD